MKIHPKKVVTESIHFLSENSDPSVVWQTLHGNKTKTTGITYTI